MATTTITITLDALKNVISLAIGRQVYKKTLILFFKVSKSDMINNLIENDSVVDASWFVNHDYTKYVSKNRNQELTLMIHSGPENLKKSRPKKLVKSNKINFTKIFLTKFHFLPFLKWPKINFWTGEKV